MKDFLNNKNGKNNMIEAVTVCIYYSAFLKYCINNKNVLDRWIIVTVEDDIDTIELCKKFSIEYCLSKRAISKHEQGPTYLNWVEDIEGFESFSEETKIFLKTIPFNGHTIAKGRAVNDGFSLLNKEGWLLHLDCDILLPKNFRQLVQEIKINKSNTQNLYGLRGRRILGAHPDFESTYIYKNYNLFHLSYFKYWKKFFLNHPEENIHDCHFPFHDKLKKKFKINKKPGNLKYQWENFIKNDWDKLIYPFDGPHSNHLGFFQLFHSSHKKQYPEYSKHIGVDDVLLAESFPLKKRKLLNFDCVHICLPASGMLDLVALDSYILNKRHVGDYSYLSKYLAGFKNRLPKITSLLLQESKSSDRCIFNISPTNLNLFNFVIWTKTIQDIKLLKFKKNINHNFHEFIPNHEKKWFGFRLDINQDLDKSNYQFLHFTFMFNDLDCDIEIGVGLDNNVIWSRIPVKEYKNKTWYKLKIEYSARDSLQITSTHCIVRNGGSSICNKGSLCIKEIHFS